MTILSNYETITQRLLQNPPATASLYALTDLDSYINTGRTQLAGESGCVRVSGSLTLAAGTNVYSFSSITYGSTTGVVGTYNIRGALVGVASGARWMRPRPFPYFQLYHLNNPIPVSGLPTVYSIFGQGESGSLYVDPIPDNAYVLQLDCVCVPMTLTGNAGTDVEAIPYPWTDAVPYYAAYMALLSSQRTADADHMFQMYQQFVQRARQISNPEVNPRQAAQAGSPIRQGQLGMTDKGK